MSASFESFGLSPSILRAVQTRGYQTPTPIQSKVIPLVMKGKDVLGCAQTGTGKTASFALPAIEQLINSTADGIHKLRVLVLSPTRELAIQIGQSFRTYDKHLKFRNTLVYGGVGQKSQVKALRRGFRKRWTAL